MNILKYKLSKDGKGLCAYFGKRKNSFYHIHSAEMTILEKWIKKLLLK